MEEDLRRPPDERLIDTGEQVARAGVQFLLEVLQPGLGFLAQLVDRIAPTRHQHRLTMWFSDVQKAFNELRRRGEDLEALMDDPRFVDYVMDATAAAIRTHREEKRKALRNAITNTALSEEPGETKHRVFLRLIADLDVHHLLLLSLLANPRAFLEEHGVPLPDPPTNPFIEKDALTQHESPRSLRSIVSTVLHEALPVDLQDLALQDLARCGLVDSKTTFSTLCAGNSLASPLGLELLRFIADPPDA